MVMTLIKKNRSGHLQACDEFRSSSDSPSCKTRRDWKRLTFSLSDGALVVVLAVSRDRFFTPFTLRQWQA